MRLFYSTLAVFFLAGSATSAHAQIVLNKSGDLDFGAIEFATSHSGTLQLGTNGGLLLSGTGIAADFNTQPGIVTVTSPSTGIVEIKCEPTGKLRNGNKSLNLGNAEVSVNSGLPFGSGNPCQGRKKNSPPAAVIDLSSTPTPNILIGAELVIPANSLSSGTYSTTANGGNPITLTVVFQ